ncbi:helix-turn-helix domain-containing protein [Nonomuraea sp. ZG12]|uniref:helix-turn-helix domain-containing protein n=1 Tax=Nonomuraea sp. ZG12 TaxID=3452207 RepID=UPI003F896C36
MVTEDVLAAARARRARGQAVTQIARELGVGRSTLYRALEDDESGQEAPARDSVSPESGNDPYNDAIVVALADAQERIHRRHNAAKTP